jgi:hypothetical protein
VAWRASKPGSRLASEVLPVGPLLGGLNVCARLGTCSAP